MAKTVNIRDQEPGVPLWHLHVISPIGINVNNLYYLRNPQEFHKAVICNPPPPHV